MRVGITHEPQAKVDVTKVPTKTTQRRMMRMIIQTKRKTGEGRAAVRAASVDDTADVEPHDPDSEPVEDTTEHNNQDLNEHAESSHDADSNPCFDEITEDNPEDELEPWVDYITRATHKADDADSSKRNHVVDPQAEPELLEAGKDDCQTPRRPLDQSCLQLEPSYIKGTRNKT